MQRRDAFGATDAVVDDADGPGAWMDEKCDIGAVILPATTCACKQLSETETDERLLIIN